MTNPKWLEWSRALQGVAQTGLTYARHPAEKERYEKVEKIAAEMLALGSGLALEKIQKLFDTDIGYATPKVGVRGVVFQDEKILLVKEKYGNIWNLPGGWAEINDSPSSSIEREVYEETGYLTAATRLLAVWNGNKFDQRPYYFHGYHMFFLCELKGGKPGHCEEILEVGFFAKEELASLDILNQARQQICRMFHLFGNRQLPPDFD